HDGRLEHDDGNLAPACRRHCCSSRRRSRRRLCGRSARLGKGADAESGRKHANECSRTLHGNVKLLQFLGVVARISVRKRTFVSWLSRLRRFVEAAIRPEQPETRSRNTDRGHSQELKRIIGGLSGKVKPSVREFCTRSIFFRPLFTPVFAGNSAMRAFPSIKKTHFSRNC